MVTNRHFQPVLGADRLGAGWQRKPQHSWKPSDVPSQATPEEIWRGWGTGSALWDLVAQGRTLGASWVCESQVYAEGV